MCKFYTFLVLSYTYMYFTVLIKSIASFFQCNSEQTPQFNMFFLNKDDHLTPIILLMDSSNDEDASQLDRYCKFGNFCENFRE